MCVPGVPTEAEEGLEAWELASPDACVTTGGCWEPNLDPLRAQPGLGCGSDDLKH